jgi:murein DD-endopeptidase MepM/ murein hydrolase activator NlpD
MIWTAVSPALVQIIKDIQSAVRWVKEWTQVNIVPYLKEFTEAMGVSGSSTRAFFVACELLIGLWIGSKGIAFLRALGTLRALLVGGRLMGAGAGAATAATAASGGLMGAIMSGLGVGAAAAAANSQNILAPPERSQSWHEAIVRAADPGIANRIYGSRAGGGEPTLMGRASGAVRRMLGLGGGAAGGSGGSMPAVPESVPMTAAERNTLGLIMKHESGGQNTMNYVGRSQGLDPTTPKGATAQGYFQMLNSNWRRIAPLYGIKTPNAMASSLEDQTKVALHLLRNGGVQNWTNYNPALRAAIARGDTAPAGGPAAAPAGPITGAKEVAGGVHPLGGGGRFKDGFGMRRHPIHGDIRMHAGVDLAAPAGTNVQAMASGTISIGRSGDVTVRHADGTSTSYRHVVPSVKEGDQVAAGQIIAQLRAHDPRSTGPHLHFEARNAKGGLIDPKSLLAPKPTTAPKSIPEAGAIPGRTAQWWRGSPNAMASVGQAQAAQAAQAARISNDNRSSSSVRNSSTINGGVHVHTAATDANGITRDMEDALKRRSLAAAANYGQA